MKNKYWHVYYGSLYGKYQPFSKRLHSATAITFTIQKKIHKEINKIFSNIL